MFKLNSKVTCKDLSQSMLVRDMNRIKVSQNTHVLLADRQPMFLEPVDSKCIYCNNEYSQKKSDNYFVYLYKEQNRVSSLFFKEVKYQEFVLEASRCPNCLKIHKDARLKAMLTAGGIEFVIMYVSAYWMSVLWIIGVIISGLIMFQVALWLEKIFVRRKGILTKHDGASKYETVRALFRHGWTFERPKND